MNEVPLCGNHGSRIHTCRCSQSQIERYQARISGPLLDRVDIQIEMPEVGFLEISEKAAGEGSSVVRARVEQARARQRARFAEDGILLNAQMNAALIKKYCSPDAESERLLHRAYERMKLSARAYQRILKVARTIADVDGFDEIRLAHYAEAIQYRSLDMGER